MVEVAGKRERREEKRGEEDGEEMEIGGVHVDLEASGYENGRSVCLSREVTRNENRNTNKHAGVNAIQEVKDNNAWLYCIT